jgi:hypothetical protein
MQAVLAANDCRVRHKIRLSAVVYAGSRTRVFDAPKKYVRFNFFVFFHENRVFNLLTRGKNPLFYGG